MQWNVACGIWLRYFEQKNSYKWHKLFTEGGKDVHDAWSERTSSEVETIIVIKNRRITIKSVAEDVIVSVWFMLWTLLGWNMLRNYKILTKTTIFDQKNRCMSIAEELLDNVNSSPDFLKGRTIDEIWIHFFDTQNILPSWLWKFY